MHLRHAATLLVLLLPATARADADALWHILHDRCAPGLAASGNPSPCAEVAYPGGEASGAVVLKDRVGATQFLLMPTARITGIEDPAILAPGATNYFQAAWQARGYFLQRAGGSVPHDAISLAVNSPHGRSQNQLHIHIDCVRADVRDTLRASLPGIGSDWAPLPGGLLGHDYRARRLDSLSDNPFVLLAQDPQVGAAGLRDQTLVVAGARFPDGRDGFVLLADRAHGLDFASGEELQDHDWVVSQVVV